MGNASPLVNNLLESLEQEPMPGSTANHTTLLRQAQVAEEWLFEKYLGAWLNLAGAVVDVGYPIAVAHRAQLRAIQRLGERLPELKRATSSERVFFLASVRDNVRSALVQMGGCPADRSMQWGVWARDVPTAIAAGYEETDFLNPVICEGIAPCCMFLAYLVSHVVTDVGAAEEIDHRMFDVMPAALVKLLQDIPVAPEA